MYKLAFAIRSLFVSSKSDVTNGEQIFLTISKLYSLYYKSKQKGREKIHSIHFHR